MNFSELSQKQKSIVEAGDGVMIVNAGPGTGKTKTLTSRIVYLIEKKHIDPRGILALTFTNRAANEMRQRLKPLLTSLPTITTFHGFCFDLLKKWGEEFGLIDEHTREEIIKRITKQEKSDIAFRDLSVSISKHKNEISPSVVEPKIIHLIELYNRELSENNFFDFDDLLQKTFTILTKDKNKRNELKKRYRYILIDEFQDVNEIQYEIVKLILGDPPELFVIGDPLQSIYGFRGSYPDIFKKLKRDFPEAKAEFLDINFRSRSTIVNASKRLFPGLQIQSFSSIPGTVTLVETLNEYTEADWIIAQITNKIGGSELLNAEDDGEQRNLDFSDFAIIYRTHRAVIALEKQLSECGLPYQIVKEDTELEGHHIKLMSMHAAKGLEFSYVFICGLEEGIIPHERSLESEKELAEEQRLLYVALTRAKKELYILHARRRNGMPTQISRFYALLDSESIIHLKDSAIKKSFKKKLQPRLF